MDIKYLNGKKIGITAFDLEQIEHRGIAAVNKSLIQLLSKNGAEIYLITSLGAKRSKIFEGPFIKNKLLEEIYISFFYYKVQIIELIISLAALWITPFSPNSFFKKA